MNPGLSPLEGVPSREKSYLMFPFYRKRVPRNQPPSFSRPCFLPEIPGIISPFPGISRHFHWKPSSPWGNYFSRASSNFGQANPSQFFPVPLAGSAPHLFSSARSSDGLSLFAFPPLPICKPLSLILGLFPEWSQACLAGVPAAVQLYSFLSRSLSGPPWERLPTSHPPPAFPLRTCGVPKNSRKTLGGESNTVLGCFAERGEGHFWRLSVLDPIGSSFPPRPAARSTLVVNSPPKYPPLLTLPSSLPPLLYRFLLSFHPSPSISPAFSRPPHLHFFLLSHLPSPLPIPLHFRRFPPGAAGSRFPSPVLPLDGLKLVGTFPSFIGPLCFPAVYPLVRC